MRIYDPRNEHGDELLTKKDANSSFPTKTEVANDYATKDSLNDKADKSQLEDKADKTALDTKADKSEMELKADKTELETKVSTDQVVSTTIRLNKYLINNTLTITTSDVPDIANWAIYQVEAVLSSGQKFQIMSDYTKGSDSITMVIGDGRSLDFSNVIVNLIRESSSGVQADETLEVLVSLIDATIASGDKEAIQTLGAKLAATGAEEYTLAGCKTGDEAVALMTGNMGAFSSPIATMGNNEWIQYNNNNFSYNLMSLESNAYTTSETQYDHGLFQNSQIQTFNSSLPSLTDGENMFWGCENLTSFTSVLPSLIDGSWMFSYCSNLTSCASNFSKLTNGHGMFGGCEKLTHFTIDLPSLIEGTCMFSYCSNLTSFTSELPSLTNGSRMFDYCNSLTYCEPKNCKNSNALNQIIESLPTYSKADGSHIILFSTGNDELNSELTTIALTKGWGVGTEDLGSSYYYYGNSDNSWYNLTNGRNMFQYDEHLIEWNYDMPNLTDGNSMFQFCSNLTSFTADLRSLTEGACMFHNCQKLSSFSSTLSSLTNGQSMFSGCDRLTTFTAELPSLTYGGDMFSYCHSLTSFTSELPNLEYARYMFVNGPIESWNIDLPKLTNGNAMFWGCSNLLSFTSDLHSLTNGYCMLSCCYNLTSFASDLSSLDDGEGMFDGCNNLTSFTSELPRLTNGKYMFSGCTNLTSFSPWGKNEDGTPKDTGATGNLTNCYYMFHNCKLDLASVKRIADWLPQRSSSKPTGSENWDAQEGWIHIGVAQGVNSGNEFNTAISKITGKKWSVVICVNGSHTTT